ncbi:hypothetical protein BD309DRAFT_607587 [Dichomitus squalens]|uniref:Uncharacterized protein n=1 Tax=Dichomitus squalens TaxID=114155 RepID=A0A4Q9P1L7_9APHY|nr:hypothetical protein BD309DRAFT_607587 [Dichomitus squalens]TBU64641.1 hypothetical protein BD310DRAFT_280135 [Dichomitus squalens]
MLEVIQVCKRRHEYASKQGHHLQQLGTGRYAPWSLGPRATSVLWMHLLLALPSDGCILGLVTTRKMHPLRRRFLIRMLLLMSPLAKPGCIRLLWFGCIQLLDTYKPFSTSTAHRGRVLN